MAKSIATRPMRTRLQVTIDSLTVSVVNNAGLAVMLADIPDDTLNMNVNDGYADMMDYYAQIGD